ncbi:MAG TPA: tRNA pseudouridine(38-40) synthase TruA [Bacteroidetes bacterium]|nr:tRNA pseudouridine(38-40) synthase TruA [Bacteroidota bacterium]
MPRYIIDIRYKGTAYAGWQVQPNATTVQGEVDRALQTLLRKPVTTYGAGRTDAGVHALKLPAHFDYEAPLHSHFQKAMNGLLPRDIAIMQTYQAAEPQFHTRFDAIRRAYRYQIIPQKDPLMYQKACWFKEKLALDLMQKGAKTIMEHDSFESFCKSNANNKTFFCKIVKSEFIWEGETLVYHVHADRFLRGMVRAIVGTLLEIGRGKIPLENLKNILAAKDRKQAGPAVTPGGLYLSEVHYPADTLIPLEMQ